MPALKCVLSSDADEDARTVAITTVNSRGRSVIDELVTPYCSSSESVWGVLPQAVGPNCMPLVFHLPVKPYLYADKKLALLHRAGRDAVKWVDGPGVCCCVLQRGY